MKVIFEEYKTLYTQDVSVPTRATGNKTGIFEVGTSVQACYDDNTGVLVIDMSSCVFFRVRAPRSTSYNVEPCPPNKERVLLSLHISGAAVRRAIKEADAFYEKIQKWAEAVHAELHVVDTYPYTLSE